MLQMLSGIFTDFYWFPVTIRYSFAFWLIAANILPQW